MGENSNERAERRVWTAGVVDEQTATVRVLGPGQDAAATALASDLLQIAEQALQDRPMAERVVTAILRNQSQLVTTATRAVTPGQREAAQEALARAVRRAVLDALPPVVATPQTDRGAGHVAADTARARKLRPVQGRATPDKGASDKIALDRVVPARSVPDKGTADQGARSRAPRSKSTPDKVTPAAPSTRIAGGRRRSGLSVLLVLLALLAALVAGLALWHFVLRPAADQAAPPPDAAFVPSAVSTTSLPEPEALQLEAVEPSGGPLRPQREAGTAPSTTADERPPAASLEPLTGRSVDTGTGAALDSAPAPGGIALPAGAGALRIFIHYPEGEPAAADADALYAALSGTGELPLVVLRDVGFTIASPRIRYFYGADAEAARALAAFLDAPDGTWALQDFSHIRPLPAPGTVEIYVPSP